MEMLTDNKEKQIQIPKQMSEEEIISNYDILNKWKATLVQAQQDEFFTKESERQANDWTMCAVGSRLQIENPKLVRHIAEKFGGEGQRDYMKKKLTDEAWDLGNRFYWAIKEDQPKLATEIFDRIQKLPTVLRPEPDYSGWKFWK